VIVLDNTDDRKLLYGKDRFAKYLPRSDNGSIIVTTRDKRVGFDFAGPSRLIQLEAYSMEESQSLLLNKCPSSARSKKLVEELEGIPLALVQAAAFIQTNSIDVEGYLDLYRRSPTSQSVLLSENFEDEIRDRDSKNPIAAKWYLSFDHIARNSPVASNVLKTMCLLDAQAIPESLLDTNISRTELVKALWYQPCESEIGKLLVRADFLDVDIRSVF
jgi:hypothetical protein